MFTFQQCRQQQGAGVYSQEVGVGFVQSPFTSGPIFRHSRPLFLGGHQIGDRYIIACPVISIQILKC
jgi:hypothetical protein